MNNITIHRAMAHLPCIDIFYRETRPADPSAPVLLCLHGRWGRGETWVNFMLHYGDRFRVVAPDQRGHGLSGKPVCRYTAAEMDADMTALLGHLGIERAIVVGHSMGGLNAAWLATNRPDLVTAVAILDKSANGPDAPDPTPLAELPLVDPEAGDWPMPFASLREAREFIRTFEETDLSYDYFMNSLVETVEGYEMMFSAQAIAANVAYYQSWFDLLPRITCPTLLVRSGSHEAVPDADWEKMQALLPNCLAREATHPDHNVYLSNEEEFYGYFDEFLSRVEKGEQVSSLKA